MKIGGATKRAAGWDLLSLWLLAAAAVCCLLALAELGPKPAEATSINIFKHRYPFYGGYYPYYGGGGFGGGFGGISIGGFGYGRR